MQGTCSWHHQLLLRERGFQESINESAGAVGGVIATGPAKPDQFMRGQRRRRVLDQFQVLANRSQAGTVPKQHLQCDDVRDHRFSVTLHILIYMFFSASIRYSNRSDVLPRSCLSSKPDCSGRNICVLLKHPRAPESTYARSPQAPQRTLCRTASLARARNAPATKTKDSQQEVVPCLPASTVKRTMFIDNTREAVGELLLVPRSAGALFAVA